MAADVRLGDAVTDGLTDPDTDWLAVADTLAEGDGETLRVAVWLISTDAVPVTDALIVTLAVGDAEVDRVCVSLVLID